VSAPDAIVNGMDTPEELRALGFTGFSTVATLRDEGAAGVPAEPGVWVVLRDVGGVPHFLARNTGANWRGKDPSETPDALGARWVARASVLYVAAAAGPGVRALLQQRVKRFLRFGMGRNVAHWEGRFVWQLAGSAALRVAWKPVPAAEARAAAQQLLDAFVERHGVMPFANEAGEEAE
jgi:hypothetical protein